ncbi:MAG: helix-turn-helix domain-containing protein [Proteiniphilum sp.]|uniref:two-component regulator propeller domain-containing protein n=1 Tax=Proteiniphilum sp. TaxID=1926877 RepID=UPI002B1F18C3|nr:two-component regulator propeller domain-containing protein [Proteiniphilum sp.]MEA5129549.1 helix-turn-helix domain-containing protein [Proteiniphilum sp.]
MIIIVYLSNCYVFGSSYAFKGVTKADGLSDLLVNVIYQDSTGFIWLGTGKGLDRFDGIKIRHYPFENALQEQRIRVNIICETTNGQIWVGNALGLWRLDENTGRLTKVVPEIINHPVNALLFDGRNRLYIGTERGFYVYDSTTIEQISISNNTFSSSNNIRGITKDNSGLFWLATVNSVIMYDAVNRKVAEYGYPDTFPVQANFRNITYLKNRLYLGTYNTGIVCFDIDKHQFSGFVDVGSDIISSVSTDGEDMIYVSTDGNGIFFISHDREEIVQSFRHDVNDPETIRSNSVYSLLVDDMKRIWIGFYQDGFDYSLYQSGLFHVYSVPPLFNSLNLTVRSFLIHDQEKLIGTRDGLYYINEKEKRVRYFNRSDLQSDLILSLAYYRDEYYIGTYGAGIYILNPQTLSLRRFSGSNRDVLQKGQIFCFRPDTEGNLWIGSSEGVARYNGVTEDMTLFTSRNSPLPEGNVYEVFFDSEGKGWFCTDKGLALFDPNTGSVRTNLFPTDFFHKEKIHVMYEDKQHQLYFLPEKGDFFVSDLNMKSFSRINKLPALQANIYTSIVEDDLGCLWLSSDGGLVRFCDKEYMVFNYMHGIPSPTFTHYAAYKDQNGLLWFGNARGLLYVNPVEIPETDQWPSILVLSDLLVNGNSLSLRELKDMVEGEQVVLKSDRNNLVFRFSDLSYTDPAAILIEYKMDRIDDDWKFLAGQNEISYFNLSPGKYIFRMRLPGNENSEISLNIKIERSIFLMPFLIFLLVFLIFFSFVVIKRRRKSAVMDNESNLPILDSPQKEDEKYRMNRLDKGECEVLYAKLNGYMQSEKPYMNKDLKIGDLADSLETSSHSLSYLFNQYLNISYYDFVNDWRIAEFKKLVAEDTSSKYTLDVLADLCGFSSRTSFFRSFKKHTGITPNEYIKSLRDN